MANRVTPRARGLWLGAAVAVMVVVPVVVFGSRTSECFDSASAADSYCTTGPAVGLGGALVLCLGGALFVAYAVGRALGGRTRTSA